MDDDYPSEAVLPDEVAAMLRELEPAARRIIELRFGLDRGEPRTLDEVALALGLSRDEVRFVEAEAVAALRRLRS